MKKTIFGIAILIAVAPGQIRAAEQAAPLVAVAANFTGAMAKIAATYKNESGKELQMVYSSTGKLYAQIRNGAPFDLFLAADQRRPDLLAEEGLCATPFIYATGQAVLWTKDTGTAGAKNWQEAIAYNQAGKIAISTPETAPYGAAAMAALEKAELRGRVDSRLVYGHNVAQAFQFAYQGSAELSFTALSLALSSQGAEGRYWPIPEAPAVVQKGCAVKKSSHAEAIAEFLDFLQRDEAKTVLAELGYK